MSLSLLSNISKVLERIMYDKARSTLQQLLILYITNTSSQTDVIYLDISKVFDTIPHTELVDKIEILKKSCGNNSNVIFNTDYSPFGMPPSH